MHVTMLLMPGPWTDCQYSTLSRTPDAAAAAAAAQQLLTHQMTAVLKSGRQLAASPHTLNVFNCQSPALVVLHATALLLQMTSALMPGRQQLLQQQPLPWLRQQPALHPAATSLQLMLQQRLQRTTGSTPLHGSWQRQQQQMQRLRLSTMQMIIYIMQPSSTVMPHHPSVGL
jgi:hypothetical protein